MDLSVNQSIRPTSGSHRRLLALCASFLLSVGLMGAATSRTPPTIPVVNQSSLTTDPDRPFTATIHEGTNGPELLVTGRVAEPTKSGARLASAIVEILVTQADGSQLWSGSSLAIPGEQLDYRLVLQSAAVLDAALIAQVTLRDREVSTVEPREARRREEMAPAPPLPARSIPVDNQSSLTTAPDRPFTATIQDGTIGFELLVTGRVAEPTKSGARLASATLEVLVTQADGSQLWSGLWPATPREHFNYRLLLQPAGVLDGALIAQVTLRDREVLTVEARERAEREARLREEAEQDAARRREQAVRAAERAAEAKREAQRQAAIRAKGWPKDIESAVIERKVAPGMSADQVTLAWGPPSRINQTTWASGVREQWVYSITQYVYFENGRVTAIQTSR